MTNQELQKLVEKISVEQFKQPFEHQATFNKRLRTTGGRYLLATHDIEINPLMLTEFDLNNLIGIIKHELVHYHLHIHHLPHMHRDKNFKQLLKQVDGLRYAPTVNKPQKPQKYWVYMCENGHKIYRQRRINTAHFVCGDCKTALKLARYGYLNNNLN
ncbi:SprT family protein [Weissella paramesenteroides]|uniref:SprT family protein n=1 Tax=Weissella paramesenteroides TaxID=1249 RepID=UPI003F7477F3